jgi:hypothetical protein
MSGRHHDDGDAEYSEGDGRGADAEPPGPDCQCRQGSADDQSGTRQGDVARRVHRHAGGETGQAYDDADHRRSQAKKGPGPAKSSQDGDADE